MEEGVFRLPAVAGVLEKGFVEARLHMDYPERIDPAKFPRALQARKELVADTPAMPTWAVVDPKTGRKLGQHQLSGGPSEWEAGFLAFLQAARP